MAAKQEATAGPCAFGIKLGMTTGLGSPADQDIEHQTVNVSASTSLSRIILQYAVLARTLSAANSCSLVAGHGG